MILGERGTIDLPLTVGRKSRVRVAAPRDSIRLDESTSHWSVPSWSDSARLQVEAPPGPDFWLPMRGADPDLVVEQAHRAIEELHELDIEATPGTWRSRRRRRSTLRP